MATRKLYRSLVIAACSAAVFLSTGCNEMKKPHKTIKAEQYERWDMAKLSIHYQLAQQQFAVGELDKCKETVDKCLALNRPHAGLQMLAGKVDLEKGALESAAAHLKEAIRIDSKDPEPCYLLGVVYQRWQKMEVAEDYYQQAADRKSTEARYMLAVVEMKITRGNLQEARQMLEDKAGYFEQTAALRVALARICSLQKDFAGAAKHYRDAFVLTPEDENLKRSYAEALFFAAKYPEAIPLLEDLRNRPAGDTKESKEGTETDRRTLTLMLGQAYLNLHRPMNARVCFQEILRDQPENATAILGLGKVCVENNELSAALSAARKVLKLDPRNAQAHLLTAMVQQKQKKWADALATLETALGIAPNDSTILCMTGISTLKLGRQSEAVTFFEKAVAANPQDPWAVELLGRAKPVTLPDDAAGTTPVETPAAVTTAAPTATPRHEAP